MHANKLYKAILYTLILLLPTSCHWFSKKDGEIGKSLLMYMAVTSNLSGSISMNMEDVENSPFVPEYFEYPKESGDILLLLEHKEKSIPKLKRLYRDEFGEIQEEILQEYDGESSIDPEFMQEVLSYANNIFPAKERGIIFSSHGTGWTPEGYYKNPTKDGITPASALREEDPYAHLVKSFGQIDGQEMDMVQMAASIPSGYSYIIFDACLMGGIEVAYELKDKAAYTLLSPTEIMAAGFPYGDLMEQVFYSEGSLENRLSALAKCYYDYYSDPDTGGGTITLVRSDKLPAVASAVKSILSKDRSSINNLNMNSLQGYFRGSIRHWFYDMTDFMESISSDPAMLDAYKKAMDEAIVVKYATDKFLSIAINTYCGLSMYVPKPANPFLDEYYKKYSWNSAVNLVK